MCVLHGAEVRSSHMQFVSSIAEAMQVSFIPFEGLLQSSGWATFVAAFSESLGTDDNGRNGNLHKQHLSTDSPRTPVPKASPVREQHSPEATPVDTSNFSPKKRI